MKTGFIKTFGKKAITISSGKLEYYALFADLDKYILEHLKYPLPFLPVKFDVVKTEYAGSTYYGKRYHAENVKLDLDF